MAGNHLEAMVAEYYELQGYFVRRNVLVGRRAKGGWECELDIVAFHPRKPALVHIETSLDAQSWIRREERYAKKFAAGRRHIPSLFNGMDLPPKIDQIALFVYGGANLGKVGGGKVLLIKAFMAELYAFLADRKVENAAIPEEYPHLRTLQFAAQYWRSSKV
jgi:hypothetical protein